MVICLIHQNFNNISVMKKHESILKVLYYFFLISVYTLFYIERLYSICECDNIGYEISLNANAVKSHTAVFSGRVARIVYVNQDDYVAKFIVYESWKKDYNNKYIYVLGSTNPDECSIPLITGHEYIVFAKSAGGNLLVLNNCSPTQEFEDIDKEDLFSMGQPENVIYPRYAITRRISYIEDIKN